MSDLIIKKLVDNIKETNLDKSSHWQKYLGENSNYLNEFKQFGFGSYTKKSPKNVAQNLLGKIIFGNKVFKTDTFKKYKLIFDKINRFIVLFM